MLLIGVTRLSARKQYNIILIQLSQRSISQVDVFVYAIKREKRETRRTIVMNILSCGKNAVTKKQMWIMTAMSAIDYKMYILCHSV